MSRKAYGGVNNTSRNGIKIYGGENNLSKNIIKGYVGVNNLSRQFWPAKNTTVGPRTDLTPGGTYELNTCLPVMAMKFALEFIRKLQKPLLNNYSIYTLYQEKKSEILADFLRNLADNNIVYVICGASSYSEGSFNVTFYLGKSENLNRQINQIYTDSYHGNTYATIVNSVATQKSISYSFNLTTKNVTRSESSFSNSFTSIGLEIDYSSSTYKIGHNIRITNLGMTMYHVDLIARGDWLWRFDFSSGMYDQVDHLKAFAKDGSESSAIGRDDWLRLPAFIWERGRTIKVKCQGFDPYWEERYDTLAIEDYGDDFHYYYRVEYSSESADHQKHYYKCYYKYYPGGDLFGRTIGNSRQYTSGRQGFVIQPTTEPCRNNQYVEQKGKIRATDLYSYTEGQEVGDMKQFAPILSYDINLNNDSIVCSLGVTAEVVPPIMNRNYVFVGQFWMRGSRTYALAGYRVTEIEVL